MTLHKGDLVALIYEDRRVLAEVALVAQNGRSFVLAFDALVACWAGAMAVAQLDDGSYRALTGHPIRIEPWTEEEDFDS